MRVPRHARWPLNSEWTILARVFGSTLPFRQRVFLTDGLGGDDAPFTIPTSAISALPPLLASAYAGGLFGPAGAALSAAITGAAVYLFSSVNLAYIVNVGPGPYPDMSSGTYTVGPYTLERNHLLVHELTHVWQGKNSIFALSYVISSAYSQCRGMVSGGGIRGRAAAYSYRPWGHGAITTRSSKPSWLRTGLPAENRRAAISTRTFATMCARAAPEPNAAGSSRRLYGARQGLHAAAWVEALSASAARPDGEMHALPEIGRDVRYFQTIVLDADRQCSYNVPAVSSTLAVGL